MNNSGQVDRLTDRFVDGWVIGYEYVRIFVDGEYVGDCKCDGRRGDMEEHGKYDGRNFRYYFNAPLVSGTVIKVLEPDGEQLQGSPRVFTDYVVTRKELAEALDELNQEIFKSPDAFLFSAVGRTSYNRDVDEIAGIAFSYFERVLLEGNFDKAHIIFKCYAGMMPPTYLIKLINLFEKIPKKENALSLITLMLRILRALDPQIFSSANMVSILDRHRYILLEMSGVHEMRHFKGFGRIELPDDVLLRAELVSGNQYDAATPSLAILSSTNALRQIPISYGWAEDCLILQQRFNVVLPDGRILINDLKFSWRKQNYFSNVREPPSNAEFTPDGRAVILDTNVKIIRSSGDHFLLGGVQNFGHWIFDHAPRLQLLEMLILEGHDNLKIVVRKKRNLWESFIIEKFGLNNLLELDEGELAHVDRCFVSSIFCQENTISSLVTSYWRKIFEIDEINEELWNGRCIFASRAPMLEVDRANGRDLKNEDEVWTLLETLGFERIVLEYMKPQEQIEAFRNVRIIVTATGSALNNILFSPKNAKIVELKTWNIINLDFVKISSAIGMDYFVIPCWKNGVDITDLEGLVKRLLNETSLPITPSADGAFPTA